eukprot:bmy_01471T0
MPGREADAGVSQQHPFQKRRRVLPNQPRNPQTGGNVGPASNNPNPIPPLKAKTALHVSLKVSSHAQGGAHHTETLSLQNPTNSPSKHPDQGGWGPSGLWAKAARSGLSRASLLLLLPSPPPTAASGRPPPPRPSPAPPSSAASASWPPGPSSSPRPAPQHPPAATSSGGPRPCPHPLQGQDGLAGTAPSRHLIRGAGLRGDLGTRVAATGISRLAARVPPAGQHFPGGQRRPPPLRARLPGGESKSRRGWGRDGPQSRNWWNQV